ncbi:MAG: hypothetical protein FJY73_04360 [Candidatus Eisenbacteria bacterium]|nr:hypothetical protein [Candidatus Eisenbacteria bacterium]
MIRRSARFALFLLVLWCFSPAAGAPAETPAEKPPREWRTERKPVNVSFLFSAFVLTWAAIWIHLLVVDRGQRRLEKILARMEEERG